MIAVTDGLDTMSVNSADRLREVAARSGALLQIVTVRSPGGSNAGFVSMRPRFRDANPLILTEAAEQTGGELRPPALFGDADLAGAVARVLNDARQSYVLTFTPQHVERGGWHELSVSVAKAPNATVRAHRGYYDK